MSRCKVIVLAILGLVIVASPSWAQSSSEVYAMACREAVGAIPEFSCANGEVVPVTVNGKPANPVPNMSCDRPALLDNGAGSDGQCVPFSRILSLSTKTMQVAVMCRQKKIRSADSLDFDELDIVAHNPTTGATCWFQALGKDGKPVDGAHVPSPTTENTVWNEPRKTAHDGCGVCHDAGPIMYSPFVEQVWKVMPVDPLGPYFHVDPAHYGFEEWTTLVFQPRDNNCTGCHRIGVHKTCGELAAWMTGKEFPPGADEAAKHYPLSHAMPPGAERTLESWNEIYAASVSQIMSCCQDPGQPSCHRTQIGVYPRG